MTPRQVLAQYLDFIEDFLPLEGRRVLDFGCGTSVIGELVEERLGSYTGVEHVAEARRRLQSRGINVVSHMRYAPNAHIVTVVEVLEHLTDPIAVLRDLSRKLEAGGVLFISTPNARSFRARILGSRWEQAQNPTHTTLFTRKGINAALSLAGLQPIAWQPRVYYGSRLVHPVLQALRLDGGLRVLVRSRHAGVM